MENGNDGSFQDELAYLNLGNSESNADLELAGDILWRYDLIQKSSFSVSEIYYSHLTVIGNYLYVALPQNHGKSTEGFFQEGDIDGLYVFDIESGKRIAGNRLYQGVPYRSKVWAVPVSGSVNGLDLVFHPSRDGKLHAYKLPQAFPRGGWHHLERMWKFEINPIDFLLDRNGLPLLNSAAEKDSNNTTAGVGISSTPVWDQGKIFIAGGQDPGQPKGQGILYCLDGSVPVNDKEHAVLWSFRDLGTTVSTASVIDDLVFIADLNGGIYCLDAESGKLHWTHHTNEMIVVSTFAVDGRLFVGTTQGRLLEFEVNRKKTLRRTIVFPDPIRNSPVAANGRLYVSTSRFFYVFD
jgi:outer membrane protein assembly factor BamB